MSAETSSLSRVSRRLNYVLIGLLVLGWIGMILAFFTYMWVMFDLPLPEFVSTDWSGDAPSRSTVMLSAIPIALGLAVFFFVIGQLRRICRTLMTGDPFVPENASRIRRIWVALAVYELVRIPLAIYATRIILEGEGTPASMQNRLSFWFLILILAVLAEVFREGARLREDQQLTI